MSNPKSYYYAKEFLEAAFRAFEAKDEPDALTAAAKAFEEAVIDTADDRHYERELEHKRGW